MTETTETKTATTTADAVDLIWDAIRSVDEGGEHEALLRALLEAAELAEDVAPGLIGVADGVDRWIARSEVYLAAVEQMIAWIDPARAEPKDIYTELCQRCECLYSETGCSTNDLDAIRTTAGEHWPAVAEWMHLDPPAITVRLHPGSSSRQARAVEAALEERWPDAEVEVEHDCTLCEIDHHRIDEGDDPDVVWQRIEGVVSVAVDTRAGPEGVTVYIDEDPANLGGTEDDLDTYEANLLAAIRAEFPDVTVRIERTLGGSRCGSFCLEDDEVEGFVSDIVRGGGWLALAVPNAPEASGEGSGA